LTKALVMHNLLGMATQVNIGEAKTHLSSLLERAAAGEEVIIAHANVPVARLVPITPAARRRTPGRLQGQIVISDDFGDPVPDLETLFHDGPIEPRPK